MIQEKKLEDTYLVQRLGEPYKTKSLLSAVGESFSFGGGYKNGGLSDDAFKLIREIFSFDYMGAAEYEFGAVPAFFRTMVTAIKDYSAWELSINKTPVYVFGPTALKELINERLQQIAKDKSGYIKCGCNFSTATGQNKYSPKERCRTIGWLELDNTFAFFTSKEVFDNFCKLFGIE